VRAGEIVEKTAAEAQIESKDLIKTAQEDENWRTYPHVLLVHLDAPDQVLALSSDTLQVKRHLYGLELLDFRIIASFQ
jgi:hypothetical protein